MAVAPGDEMVAGRDRPGSGGRVVQEGSERDGAHVEGKPGEDAPPSRLETRITAFAVLRVPDRVVRRPAELPERGRELVHEDAVDRVAGRTGGG